MTQVGSDDWKALERVKRVKILLKLTSLYGRRCWYCGDTFTAFKQVEVDHIVPKSRGGEHTISNLAIACVPCNRAKGDMQVAEFLRWLRRPKKPLPHIHERAKQSELAWKRYGKDVEKGLRHPPDPEQRA